MKKILILCLIAIMSFGLIGCGAKEKANSEDEKAAMAEAIKEQIEQEAAAKEEAERVAAEQAAAEEAEAGKEEILNYLREVKPLVERVTEIAQVYEVLRQQSANGEIDDYEFYDGIAIDVQPAFIDISDEVQTVMPSAELRDLHELLIGMIAKNTLAMTELMSAIDYGDASLITSANSILMEARKLERDFVYKLQETYEIHNISPEDI